MCVYFHLLWVIQALCGCMAKCYSRVESICKADATAVPHMHLDHNKACGSHPPLAHFSWRHMFGACVLSYVHAWSLCSPFLHLSGQEWYVWACKMRRQHLHGSMLAVLHVQICVQCVDGLLHAKQADRDQVMPLLHMRMQNLTTCVWLAYQEAKWTHFAICSLLWNFHVHVHKQGSGLARTCCFVE